ncbi:MAG: AraC family transcriptional regulator [Gammaproteobacteria bacterium]|nr:AraC family transcriptional regulator [Gammaproteobacteria bacterium]
MKQTITVPIGYVKQLLERVAEQNYDVNELLEYVGIDPEEIQHQTEFPAEKIGYLYQRIMYITQDEYFGMLSGGRLPSGAFRMMCHAIIQCKNLGHAIRRASDFHEIVKGTRIKPKLEKKGRFAKVSFAGLDSLDEAEVEKLIASEPVSSISTSLSMWHHFVSWLIGERLELRAAYFSFSEEEAVPGIHTKFQSELRFEQHDNAMVFPARYLEYPIVQTEESLHGFLKTAPYQLLVMADDSTSLKAQIVALIGRDFSMPIPTAKEVANTLNMSLSKLRRRLLEEDTTFQQIKDDCRKKSAINYMNSPQLSINDVAGLMGFEEPSAFFRSFKRWTGMTPGEYRQSTGYRNQLETKQ